MGLPYPYRGNQDTASYSFGITDKVITGSAKLYDSSARGPRRFGRRFSGHRIEKNRQRSRSTLPASAGPGGTAGGST